MPRKTLPLSGLLRDALLDLQVAAPDGTFDPLPERFRFIRKIGQGGWGTVWVARDANLGRLVAIKLISAERAELATQILKNEGAQLARLRPHPNIVQVHSWERIGDACFVALQYVGGGSLRTMLETFGPLGWSRASRYIADTADGLARVHEHGLLHRDIKPDNLLLDVEQDQVLLTDFGFAGTPAEMQMPVGTPGYAAPEALYQAAVAASDVYSLAATLFDLVVGHPPFQGGSVEEIVASACTGSVPQVPAEILPAGLMKLVRSTLSPSPESRPTLKEFREQLRGSTALFTTDTLFGDAAGQLEARGRPRVSLRIHRFGPGGKLEEVRPVEVQEPTRDLAYAGASLPIIGVRDGDLIQLSIEASESGHITVLNVGPTGNLTTIVPNADLEAATIHPGQPFVFPPIRGGRIEVRPPAGVERIVTLWTRRKPPFDSQELYRQLVAPDSGPEDPGAYYATRQLVYVAKEAKVLDSQDVAWSVVAIDHQPSTSGSGR